MARYLILRLGGIDPENHIEPPLAFSLQRQIKKKKLKNLEGVKYINQFGLHAVLLRYKVQRYKYNGLQFSDQYEIIQRRSE